MDIKSIKLLPLLDAGGEILRQNDYRRCHCGELMYFHSVFRATFKEPDKEYEYIQLICYTCGLSSEYSDDYVGEIGDDGEVERYQCRHQVLDKYDASIDKVKFSDQIWEAINVSLFHNVARKMEADTKKLLTEMDDIKKRQSDVASGQIESLRLQLRQVQNSFSAVLVELENNGKKNG